MLPALREYNLSQFITADVPGHQHQVSVHLYLPTLTLIVLQTIVSEAALVPPVEGAEEGERVPDRFWDPRSRTSFRFDHLTLVSSYLGLY